MVSNVIDHPYREFEHSGWERAAPSYAGSFEAATGLFAFSLLESVGIRKHMDLLDVACGTGLVTRWPPSMALRRLALISHRK